MTVQRAILGTLVAVGLFTLAGSKADAQHLRPAPIVVRQACVVPTYAPVYSPVFVQPAPAIGFGAPVYGYHRSFYSTPAFSSYSFGYTSGGFVRGFHGQTFYTRPGFSFGFTTFR